MKLEAVEQLCILKVMVIRDVPEHTQPQQCSPCRHCLRAGLESKKALENSGSLRA